MLSANKKTTVGFILGAVILATTAFAATAQEAVDARHQGMKDIGKALKAAFAESKNPAPDIAVFKTSAATITGASDKMVDWFPTGSGPDKVKTEATANIWTDQPGFATAVSDYKAAATAFRIAAEAGDLDTAKAKLAPLSASCKGCHEKYREKD